MTSTLRLAGRDVTRLGLGTMSLTGPGTWGPPRSPEAARLVLRRAAELGVELFDTADSYGPGVSEILLAEALHPYGGVLVATKGGLTRQGPGRWSMDCRPPALRSACEESLRRLRVETVDLYQLHCVDPAVPLEESLGVLFQLRDEGKIRHVGVCNVDAAQLGRALAAGPIVSVQNRYSLLDRASEPVLEACERGGLAFIAWAPLGKGRATRLGERATPIARRHDATGAQLALAWLLERSDALVPIPGTGDPAHLEENVGATAVELSAEEVEALGRLRFPRYRASRMVRRARASVGRVRAMATHRAGR